MKCIKPVIYQLKISTLEILSKKQYDESVLFDCKFFVNISWDTILKYVYICLCVSVLLKGNLVN